VLREMTMKSEVNQSLARTLECAVIVSWADLIHDSQSGLIHIEYGFAPIGTLEYLKIWSSLTRGHWLLACEYWMSASGYHGSGVHFDNGYESETLSNILERVMQHQTAFVLPENMGRQGLLQIPTPTEQDHSAAGQWIDAFDRLGSALTEPALA
jgi:hypothetical protein